MNTDGQICYGILFEEGYEFPWDIEPWDGAEAWWRDVNGYESLEYPWAANGAYKPGYSADDPRVREYFIHRRTWDEVNPFPITLVDCGYCDLWILAVTSSFISCDSPEAFNPADLIVHVDETMVLLDFCRRWDIELHDPKWWLNTYQG